MTGLGAIAPDASFTVRVTVTAEKLASPVGKFVSIQFGNTLDNGIAQNQQNIPDGTDTPNNQDLRTIYEGLIVPANGEREAAAFRQEAFNTAPTKLAQALLLKTSTYDDLSTPDNPVDDTIVYNLQLKVDNQSFTSTSIDPGNLEGTRINLKTGSGAATVVERILISDVVPANTVFDAGFIPTAPSGWTTVYSTDAVGTINPLQTEWKTVRPTIASDIKRVGFIYDATVNPALAPLTTVTGFSFRVVTSGLTSPGGTIANIAQVFGETEGDIGNNVVYDESGDQSPNNFNDGFTPINNTTTFNPSTDFGVGNANDPERTSNANDGTGSKGESNVVTISVIPLGDLFNGPNGAPAATGKTNTNDDFTNVSAPISVAGPQGAPSNPGAVTITNQVQNPAGALTYLGSVTLLPLDPNNIPAGVAGDFSEYSFPDGTKASLPDGTLVTIKFGTQEASYRYTSATGFRSSTDSSTTPQPVLIGRVEPGEVKSYTVTIDLPNGTKQIAGYGVPIVAFVNNDGNKLFTPNTENTFNVTIDRVYTGFMRLLKEAQIIYAPRDGTTLPPSGFSSDPTSVSGFIPMRPSDTIEYRITYTNISEVQPPSGLNNVVLVANDFVLTENGNISSGNNWATVTNHLQNTIFSSGSTVTYTDSSSSTTYNADPASGTRVDVYTNTVSAVDPGEEGALTFSRQLR